MREIFDDLESIQIIRFYDDIFILSIRSFLETVKDHVQIIFRAVAAGSTPVDNFKNSPSEEGCY